MGFEQSDHNDCIFLKGDIILAIYVDNGILYGPNKKDIYSVVTDLQSLGYDVEMMGNVEDFLGVKVDKDTSGNISLTQPQLIDSILKDLGFNNDQTKTRDIPAPSSVLLMRDPEGQPFKEIWHYPAVIGKLNFLEQSTRGDLGYSVHQCARFTSDPKKSHSDAVKHKLEDTYWAQETKGYNFDPSKKIFKSTVMPVLPGLVKGYGTF